MALFDDQRPIMQYLLNHLIKRAFDHITSDKTLQKGLLSFN